jgi:MtrB/PioB family decaheme-associated outer membrane protein
MKAHQHNLPQRISVLAVHAAILAMAMSPVARAGDAADPAASAAPAVTALTKPTNQIEAGVGSVDKDSAKFGEYNGLNRQGAFGILNFIVKGGAYGSDTDPTRWSVKASDLGLDSRSIAAEYAKQGTFRVNLGFDDLRRNRSDTYQTPYNNTGNAVFMLPSNWLAPRVPQVSTSAINFRSFSANTGLANALVNGVSVAPTAAQTAQVNSIIANDVPAFHTVELRTKREKYEGSLALRLAPQWELVAGFKHEDKTGAKPMGTVSSQVSEFSATLADPIDQTTEHYNLGLNFTGERAFFSAAYNGSFFKNRIKSVTWQDVNDLTRFATMSSAPDNQYHQLNFVAGYKYSSVTRVVVNASYARATQNEPYLVVQQNANLPMGVPVNSLDGRVVTKALNARWTTVPVKDLNVSANYKYDERDNRTAIHTYFFQDANETRAATASPFNAPLGLAANTLASNINIYNNRPYSRKTNQLNLDADYRLTRSQNVKLGYDWQKIERYCSTSWIACADAAASKENTVRAEWRASLTEDLSARVGYAYAERRVDNYNENAFLSMTPMANVLGVGGAATSGTTVATQSALAYMIANGLTGYGPFAGYLPPYTGNALIYGNNGGIIPQALYGSRNNINELPGLRRYNMADRNRDKVRTSVNWDASETFSVQGSVDLNKDNYNHSVYGLKRAEGWAFNLDSTLTVSETFSASLFYTIENQKSKSAGDAYGSNSATANVNGFTAISPGVCYTTIAARNLNAKQDPCLNWDTDNRDKVDTVGVTARKKGLMAGKLDLGGDLVYARARTDINVNGGSYANNPLAVAGAPVGTIAAYYIPAAALPTVNTTTTTLRVKGQYALDKDAAVRVSYLVQKMTSNDYMYAGMQFGTGTNYLPTLEQAPNYTVHVVGLTYLLNFR